MIQTSPLRLEFGEGMRKRMEVGLMYIGKFYTH